MTKAVEEAVGNHFGLEMQRAMLQGHLTRAMEGMSAVAAIKVGEVKRESCQEEEKKFYCKFTFPLIVRDERHQLKGEATFWYDANKKLVADINNILNAPATKS
jgi:hypothetical protein